MKKLVDAIREGKEKDGEHILGRMFSFDINGNITGSCALGYALFSVLTPEERNREALLNLLHANDFGDYHATIGAIEILTKRGVDVLGSADSRSLACDRCDREKFHSLWQMTVHLNDSHMLNINDITKFLKGGNDEKTDEK